MVLAPCQRGLPQASSLEEASLEKELFVDAIKRYGSTFGTAMWRRRHPRISMLTAFLKPPSRTKWALIEHCQDPPTMPSTLKFEGEGDLTNTDPVCRMGVYLTTTYIGQISIRPSPLVWVEPITKNKKVSMEYTLLPRTHRHEANSP